MIAIDMNASCFSITHLESLSTDELNKLAADCDLDIPDDLDRIFIIEELFDYGMNLNNNAGDNHAHVQHEPREIAELPVHYSISFIDILIRDPLWAFAFWEINDHDKNQYKKNREFRGFCLRIIPLNGMDMQRDSSAVVFTVDIDEDDNAQYLGFPPESSRCNLIELCALMDDRIMIIAASAPFTLPGIIEPMHEEDNPISIQGDPIHTAYRNPLTQLSGAGSYRLTRSVERIQRSLNR